MDIIKSEYLNIFFVGSITLVSISVFVFMFIKFIKGWGARPYGSYTPAIQFVIPNKKFSKTRLYLLLHIVLWGFASIALFASLISIINNQP